VRKVEGEVATWRRRCSRGVMTDDRSSSCTVHGACVGRVSASVTVSITIILARLRDTTHTSVVRFCDYAPLSALPYHSTVLPTTLNFFQPLPFPPGSRVGWCVAERWSTCRYARLTERALTKLESGGPKRKGPDGLCPRAAIPLSPRLEIDDLTAGSGSRVQS
jgi:hypothetical protein